MTAKEKAFLDKLMESQEWPNAYTYKFIFKSGEGHEDRIHSFFDADHKIQSSLKNSKKANFISLTIVHHDTHPEHIVHIYKKVHQVKGIIAL